jgi:hypothetical protein
MKSGSCVLARSQIQDRSAEEDQADNGRDIALEEGNQPPIGGLRTASSERKSHGPSVVE